MLRAGLAFLFLAGIGSTAMGSDRVRLFVTYDSGGYYDVGRHYYDDDCRYHRHRYSSYPYYDRGYSYGYRYAEPRYWPRYDYYSAPRYSWGFSYYEPRYRDRRWRDHRDHGWHRYSDRDRRHDRDHRYDRDRRHDRDGRRDWDRRHDRDHRDRDRHDRRHH